MTPKRTKTVKVKGVALFGSFDMMRLDTSYLADIETYGHCGNNGSRTKAIKVVRYIKRGTWEHIVDCTITFQLPNRRTNTKGEGK